MTTAAAAGKPWTYESGTMVSRSAGTSELAYIGNLVSSTLGANVLLTKTYLENVMLQAIASHQLMQYLFGYRELTTLPRCGLKVLTELFRTGGLYPAGADVILDRFTVGQHDRLTECAHWKSTVHLQELVVDPRTISAGGTDLSISLLPYWKKPVKSSISFYVEMESDEYKLRWNDVCVRVYRKPKQQQQQQSDSHEQQLLPKWWNVSIDHLEGKIGHTDGLDRTTISDELIDLYQSPEGWSVMYNHDEHECLLTILTSINRQYSHQCYYMHDRCPNDWLQNLDSYYLYYQHGDAHESDDDYSDDEEERSFPGTVAAEKNVINGWIAQVVDNATLAHRVELRRQHEADMISNTLHESDSDTDDDDMEGQWQRWQLKRMLRQQQGLHPASEEEGKMEPQEVFARMDQTSNLVTLKHGDYQINWFTHNLQLAIAIRHGPTGVTYQSLGFPRSSQSEQSPHSERGPQSGWSRYYNPTTNFDSQSTTSLNSEMDHLLPLVEAYYSVLDSIEQRDLVLYGHPTFQLNMMDGSKVECKVSKGYDYVTCVVATAATTVESSPARVGAPSASGTRYVVTTNGKKTLDLVIGADGEYKIATGIPGETITKESFLMGWKGGVDEKTRQPCLIQCAMEKPPYPAPAGEVGARIAQNQYHQFGDDDHFLKFYTQESRIDGVWRLKPFFRCITQDCHRIALYVDNRTTGGRTGDNPIGRAVCVACSTKLQDARLVDFELYVEGASADGDRGTVAVSSFQVATPLEYVINTVVRAEGKFTVGAGTKTGDTRSCNRPGIYFFLTRDRLYDYVFAGCVLLEQTVTTSAEPTVAAASSAVSAETGVAGVAASASSL